MRIGAVAEVRWGGQREDVEERHDGVHQPQEDLLWEGAPGEVWRTRWGELTHMGRQNPV